ncbi:M23 family metallopeptidase [Fodinibius sp. Rm-B-1B1-1]|uniref:M23 family metallopeptidase n=1 Tax=Fodinibius alkaliphilus TaxID=3140241 RepID=UPI00315AF037
MRKIILPILFILLGALYKSTTAQAVFIWDDISETEFTLWARNHLPCPVYLKAKPDSLNQTFEHFLPKGSQHQLVQLPLDSLTSPAEFKKQIQYNLTLGNPNAVHDSSYRYMLPYPQGQTHLLIQGNNSSFTHHLPHSKYAFDFDMPPNSLVCAARGGIVGFVSVNNKKGGDNEDFIQQANKILICHDDGTVAVYAHLQHRGTFVNVGEHVYAGQVIGLSGNTGYSTTPHLHFVVLSGSNAVPIKFKMLPDTLQRGHFYEQKLTFNK